jgi:hypothetical protein
MHGDVHAATFQRPTIRCRCSGYRAPCTAICEAARSISRRSSAVNSIPVAAMFSSSRCSFVVPGIGTIHRFCASSRNHHVITHRGQRFADELFVGERAVGFRCVAEAHAHAAEPER